MTFFDRYAAIAEKYDLDPCSQKAADLFSVTRAALSTWNTKGTTPKGEIVARIADALRVSADYLLGRTDDPTDYANGETPDLSDNPDLSDPVIMDPPIDENAPPPKPDGNLNLLINQLDESDRIRAEGVIQGMLMQEKYIHGRKGTESDDWKK